MIDFWLPAGLLLLTALAFLLIPVLRIRKLQAEEDRTALNVTLYQVRLQELDQRFPDLQFESLIAEQTDVLDLVDLDQTPVNAVNVYLAIGERAVDRRAHRAAARRPICAGPVGLADRAEHALDPGVLWRAPHFCQYGDPRCALAGGRGNGGDGRAAGPDHGFDPVSVPGLAVRGLRVELLNSAQEPLKRFESETRG